MAACDAVCVTIKWSGKEYSIDKLSPTDTVGYLKEVIKEKTGVLPERQKLLGLKYKGKTPDDDVRLSALNLKSNTKIMMMGTREEKLAEVISPSEELLNNQVINDFDIEEEEIQIENRDENLAKIDKRISDYKVEIRNPPRAGKKLLVLDVDYTIFDHRSVAETGVELMRPYLHDFLTAAYEHYDIAIWSATSMKWIEAKMKELGIFDNPNYKISFLLDSGAMITVLSTKYGLIETKPLGVIWGKFEEYTSKNTIMFDDLRRNFLMNPQNGLKIRPFREAHKNRHKDRELLKLTKYLKKIAKLDDLSDLNHKHWESYKP
ncbi:ubiquitin-like domain-containing CTD phosphatase 1 [Pocillopora verrucosa]|uniref:ubiquitin-like domain-containing CTD phosphatase 1 n=1 Tax=Pocillopora verrucosa TaxID=203993 RepID=UPI002796F941|nr:ubiquitin-like domain-containing CTD phosphatase 1 [Pocillopora verrucosa]